jgi:hypothetical protein
MLCRQHNRALCSSSRRGGRGEVSKEQNTPTWGELLSQHNQETHTRRTQPAAAEITGAETRCDAEKLLLLIPHEHCDAEKLLLLIPHEH